MHLSVLLSTAIFAVIVSSQTLTGLPDCSIDCVTNSLPADCNLKPECICKSDSFINGISCCVYNACNTTDQQAALNYAHGICDPVGASSLLPSVAGCTASATNGTASATGGTTSATSGSGSASAASATSSPAAGDRIVAQGLGAVGAAVLGLAAFL